MVSMKTRQIEWSRIESPEIQPYKYNQLILDIEANATEWSKGSHFNRLCQNKWTSTYKKMNPNTNFVPFPKIKSRWIINLNIKQKTKNLLEDKIGENLNDLGFSHDFKQTNKHQRHNP